MKKTISILIYEKEFFLNSILKEQLSKIAKFPGREGYMRGSNKNKKIFLM